MAGTTIDVTVNDGITIDITVGGNNDTIFNSRFDASNTNVTLTAGQDNEIANPFTGAIVPRLVQVLNSSGNPVNVAWYVDGSNNVQINPGITLTGTTIYIWGA